MNSYAMARARNDTWTTWGARLIALCLFAAGHADSTEPTLEITSPTTGTVVRMGETIIVTVKATPEDAFREIVLIGERPLPLFIPAGSDKFHFSLTIPNDIVSRKYSLTATALADHVVSQPISISVEPGAPVAELTVEPSQLEFNFVGDEVSLQVYSTTADGDRIYVTESTAIVYASRDQKVATVSDDGLVIATGPGNTEILVNKTVVAVSVPRSIPGDLDADGEVDIDDLHILQSTAMGPGLTTSPNAQDLNNDGTLDALDEEILKSLFTHPMTATESAVISILKEKIYPAMVQFQAGGYVDQDHDGAGEYGLLSELTARRGTQSVEPGTLDYGLGQLSADGDVDSYHYVAFLPAGPLDAIGEPTVDGPRATNAAAADLQEKFFVVYAWPRDGGGKAFSLTAGGVVLWTFYQGIEPTWSAVFGRGWNIHYLVWKPLE
jgi:hypothetical protein